MWHSEHMSDEKTHPTVKLLTVRYIPALGIMGEQLGNNT